MDIVVQTTGSDDLSLNGKIESTNNNMKILPDKY